MCKQNSAAEGGRLSSARARLSGPAGWAVGCRSATCNRDEAAGLCGHARQRHARQGAAPHPAEPMPPRPRHSVDLPAGAAAAHSQSVPVSRPSFMPLAQDSSARSAGEGGGRRASRAVRWRAQAGRLAQGPARRECRASSPASVGLTFALVCGSAQECYGRGERQRERHAHGAGLRFRERGKWVSRSAGGRNGAGAGAGAGRSFSSFSSSGSTTPREGGLLRCSPELPHPESGHHVDSRKGSRRQTCGCAGGGWHLVLEELRELRPRADRQACGFNRVRPAESHLEDENGSN